MAVDLENDERQDLRVAETNVLADFPDHGVEERFTEVADGEAPPPYCRDVDVPSARLQHDV